MVRVRFIASIYSLALLAGSGWSGKVGLRVAVFLRVEFVQSLVIAPTIRL